MSQQFRRSRFTQTPGVSKSAVLSYVGDGAASHKVTTPFTPLLIFVLSGTFAVSNSYFLAGGFIGLATQDATFTQSSTGIAGTDFVDVAKLPGTVNLNHSGDTYYMVLLG